MELFPSLISTVDNPEAISSHPGKYLAGMHIEVLAKELEASRDDR